MKYKEEKEYAPSNLIIDQGPPFKKEFLGYMKAREGLGWT